MPKIFFNVTSNISIRSEVELTSEADYLICSLYKYYLELRSAGNSRERAKSFGSSEQIAAWIPELSFDDIEDVCRELNRAGLLIVRYADNICYEVYLSNDGIIYMENRFKNKLESVIEHLKTLKSIFSPLV